MENGDQCAICHHEENNHDGKLKYCTVKDCKCPHFISTLAGDTEGAVITPEHGDGGI